MNARDTIIGFGQTMLDLLARYLSLFGDEAFSRFVAFAILLSAGALIVLLILSGWVLLSKRMRLPANATLDDDARLHSVPLFRENVPVASRNETLSADFLEIRAAIEGAICGLVEERQEQAGRLLNAQDDTRARLSKIEGAMNGMLATMDRSGAQMAAIDRRLDALRESVADLSERLAPGADEHDLRFPSNLPVAKISAEIAEIVRELQEG